MDNMSVTETDRLLRVAANGNVAALDFLQRFLHLAHKIDDVIDDEITAREDVLQVFMLMVIFFSTNPFYVEHRTMLFPVIICTLDHYANSVMWENSSDESKRRLADVLRSMCTQVVNFTALLCAGGNVDGMRSVSPQFQLDSWATHHDVEGRPI